MKAILGKIRPSKRLLVILAAAFGVSAASGGAAVYVSRDALMTRLSEPKASGLECTTIRTLKLGHNGQRWIRMHVKTDRADGQARIRTALRVAGALAKAEKADLYQVIVLDAAGPEERAQVRGAAIGAEVLFAPGPQSVPGMSEMFRASYNDGTANSVGAFHGKTIDLSLDDVRGMMAAMDDHSSCIDPSAAPAEEAAADAGAGEHEAKPAETAEAPAGH
ncbi:MULTISPECIES: hypothetical protein [unclassified Ensifer]|uniref:hypothetical protein n=1 Tax=unclassified Ensifer TaxID=2633371 RepID=UPI000812D5E9|nr:MULTISPECIES: hypothetical protein [unclassified Ensifer]OCP05466.1 hypothetical protein BC362_13345 [Ensifer sp. LC14]OCP06989.1 hypothetical protein BBX50_23090 [Ensifer sp. LC11]OCP07446.1 hypothetical protein BC374_23305 [Ensifer sp. LC13]OCP31747.1 hypothetical protein BC364_22555 [Ensifer sp. LC499]